MLLSFVYLAFSALLQLLMGSRRSKFARDVELLVLRQSAAGASSAAAAAVVSGSTIAPSSRRSAGCSSLDDGTG
jgi:hypothetical protein